MCARAPPSTTGRREWQGSRRVTSRDDDLHARLLATVRLRTERFTNVERREPWAVAWPERRGAWFLVVVRGTCSLQIEGDRKPVALREGDLVLLPRGDAHTVSVGAPSPTTAIDLARPRRKPHAAAATQVVCGELGIDTPGHPLVVALPHLLRKGGAAEPLRAVRAVLGAEASREPVGTIVARLVEVLCFDAIRSFMRGEIPSRAKKGLLVALAEPGLARAIAAVHAAPRRDHTLVSLAAASGRSRSVFALRFQRAMGEPPVTYATRVRMIAAAERLRDVPTETVAEVGLHVGYASDAAFTRAFTRIHGITPARFRDGSNRLTGRLPQRRSAKATRARARRSP
jgi:AraC-like DNA-binding protein